MPDDNLKAWVRERIERLRPRLLDLTKKNPLLSTRLNPRTNSYVRVVDELPDVLAFNLGNQRAMRFTPLPSLEADPVDEQSTEFKSAFAEAQRTDDTYIESVSKLSADDPESEEKTKVLDRALKDQVREQLGMPARETTGDISLARHARLHGVSPEYDLPLTSDENDDGRHRDDEIQTLLLPDQMERKLNALVTKCNTWIQETGINVLHGAYGFLEWQDAKSDKSAMSPLVLMPVGISKNKTPDGPEYWIRGLGEAGETNLVLSEMLKRDFDIDLPAYEGGSIEEYLDQVATLEPKNLKVRVRRQVVFGVFPSARMAMYYDLDPSKTAIHNSPIVSQLMGGRDPGEASPFADEYDVESPEIEKKIPCLVTEADSSQLSVLVDLADGRSIAVEGPPGTGKSQTIVNAIAAAIAEGKKVLFVAEKMAALEVVKSRLEALELGEFVLPLQAERSTREQVISSVRDRINMPTPRSPRDYDEKLAEYRRLRSNLNAYVEVVASSFGETGLSVYEALGKAINTSEILQGRDDVFVRAPVSSPDRITRAQLDQITEAAQTVDRALDDLADLPDYWSGVAPKRFDKIELDQIRSLAKASFEKFEAAAALREKLSEWSVPEDISTEELQRGLRLLEDLENDKISCDTEMFRGLSELDDFETTQAFILLCKRYQEVRSSLNRIVLDCDDPNTLQAVSELQSIASKGQYSTLDPDKLVADSEAYAAAAHKLTNLRSSFEPLLDDVPELSEFELKCLRVAQEIISTVDPTILRLRNENNRDPAAIELLKLTCEDGARLRAEREEIESKARIPSDLSVAELNSNARILEQAGMFSLFSAEVRKAKRLVKALAVGKPPKSKAGAEWLRSIADWKERFANFERPEKRSNFGAYYDGTNTDFGKFRKLAGFYEALENELRGANNRGLRKLLKERDSETLLELPRIEDVEWDGIIGDIPEAQEIFEQNSKSTAEDAERLASLAPRFINLANISIASLSDLEERLSLSLKMKEEAERNTAVQAAIGESFEGGMTKLDKLNWHTALHQRTKSVPDLEQGLQAAISQGSSNSLSQGLSLAIAADHDAMSSLNELSERSGKSFSKLINISHPASAAIELNEAANDEAGLSANASLARAYANLRELGCQWVPAPNDLGAPRLTELLEASIYRSMAAKIMDRHGALLNKFPGSALNEMRSKLASLDKQILKLSRKQLRSLVASNSNPPIGRGTGPKSGWTELSLLQNEIAKQKRFVSVRDLTDRAGRSLQELKPCWMMSPLAVAQYLPANQLQFDICIIDEASQMKPEDALGALARSKQAMVVGDANQLPPSNFFQKMVADDDDDEQGASVDEESILEISNAKLRPSRRLRWHYRSQHSDLIRFSNEVIYERSLVIFPSSDEQRPDMGVSLVPVEGLYHNSVNPIEAKTMVEAAVRFMRERPDLSLGIVTLNQKQRDLLIDEMGYALDTDEQASSYVETWNTKKDGLEKFFIKNLENVQGDERDVIFIGTVYGPDREGARVAQRFGPINGTAGRRRLNVLFTRAKKQIVTFSSLKPSDISATESSNPGTNMLKRWLEYSGSNVLEQEEGPYADTDSDFEDYVIAQIRSMGCEAVPQVGCAGYRIDIGVKHPSWPYGFILAVECDGATYHSTRSARDRDRLRQEVLERLGWHFHRIWSTDWFNDPRAETERLRAAIAERLEVLKDQPRDAVDLTDLSAPKKDNEAEQKRTSEPDLFSGSQANDETPVESNDPLFQSAIPAHPTTYIEIGDTVRVKYLSGTRNTIQITITQQTTTPEKGIIAAHEPLAEALLGAENGDEIEVLIGSKVRKALIEKVEKAAAMRA